MNLRGCCNRYLRVGSRRDFLEKSAFGFGTLALSFLMDQGSMLAGPSTSGERAVRFNPLAPKAPHFPAKAKNCIFVFLEGGASHVDTFDPKPELNRLDGQSLPPSFKSKDLIEKFYSENTLMSSPFGFRKFGQSGIEITEIFENLAQHVDDLAIIRSCYHDTFAHGPALSLLHSGTLELGHPSIGAWTLYGLGAETEDLPAYVVMEPIEDATDIQPLYSSGFLPAVCQGTRVRTQALGFRGKYSDYATGFENVKAGDLFDNMNPPSYIARTEQQTILNQINEWNERHRVGREHNTELAARIASYERAFRTQMAAPDLVDFSGEPASIRTTYGLDQDLTAKFGSVFLLARRMVERGVRFVQVFTGNWDTAHRDCAKYHQQDARMIDKPLAGLISDLKQRGLLESTLIVCTSEFGRSPVREGKLGRNHHPNAFTTWMAGGGIQGGKVIGATDELGIRVVEDKVHVRDLHATILSLLGLDHQKLVFPFHGLDEKLTGVFKVENDLSRRLVSG